jgi:hypothetical protein
MRLKQGAWVFALNLGQFAQVNEPREHCGNPSSEVAQPPALA